MPRIPVYTSRVAAPGPIPGFGDDLAAPGRALARFGGAIAGFGEDLARRDARKKAAERGREAQADADRNAPQDESDGTPETATPEEQEEAARTAADNTAARLDEANDDAQVSVMRADALHQAAMDADPEQLTARALAYFDAATAQLIESTGDRDRRARRQLLVGKNRDVLIARAEQRRTGHMGAVLVGKLTTALNVYAGAVRRDAAMLPAMLSKGADAIADSAHLAGLGPERVAAMTTGWVKQAHVALLDGTIERDPALALASLESGELDAPLGNDKATIGRLNHQARTALAAAEADRRQQARTQRNLFELDKAEHLERIRRTGRGDPETEALAGILLDAGERAAFRDEVAAAEAHYAARRRYAFMTEAEIAADIAQKAPGGGPRDIDGSQAAHETGIAARDAILAERSKDPAGWAMRDETVAKAFAAAEEAVRAAESTESGPAEAEAADRLYQRALALRLQAQREMGEEPRLLVEADRDALAVELQSLPPADRLVRIDDLRRRYGDHFATLTRELAGRIGPDTEILMAWSRDPILAGMLARGMAMDGAEFRGARVLSLPLAGGRLDTGRLEDRQLYRFMAGGRVVDVVYDRKANALVPALADDSALTAGAGPVQAPDTQEDPRAQTDRGTATAGSGIARTRPSPVGAERNKEEAITTWIRLAKFGKHVPGGWKELPRLPDGRIDRHALEVGQVYHVVGADGVRSAWRWTEKDRAFIPLRGRTIAFSIDGMHELIGIPVRRAPDGRPIYNMERDRINAIVWGIDAVFEVADNPDAEASDPPQAPLVAGYANATVAKHGAMIERLAEEHGVDPDLVKAIMYREQAAGPLQPAADVARIGDTISPMGVNPDIWGGLAGEGSDFYDAATNIEVGVMLIRRIEDRLADPTPEKIATLYNGLAKETVSDYGARVGRYYRDKPWLHEGSADSPPQNSNVAP